MRYVILDTNFLYIPKQFNVDIFDEIDRLLLSYKLFIFDKTIDEIDDKTTLRLVEHKIENKSINVLKTDISYIDNAIVDFVKAHNNEYDIVIATQDQELKKRLLDYRVSFIVLRGKNHLELQE